MSIRYCRSCPPGTPTRLSRFNAGDQCGPCVKARRDEWLAHMRAEYERRQSEEALRDAIPRLVGLHGPLTERQLCELTGKCGTQMRQMLADLRRGCVIERATMLAGINRYRLVARPLEDAA